LRVAGTPPASDVPMSWAGAATSGLILPSRVGPSEEKPGRLPTRETVLRVAIVCAPLTLMKRSLSAYEPAVIAWRDVPGMPTLLPRLDTPRLTNPAAAASDSFHRSN